MAEQQPQLGPMPAYISVLRYMKSHGLLKRPRRGPVHSPGAQAAERRYEAREIRSYESEYVHALLMPAADFSPWVADRLAAADWDSIKELLGFIARNDQLDAFDVFQDLDFGLFLDAERDMLLELKAITIWRTEFRT